MPHDPRDYKLQITHLPAGQAEKAAPRQAGSRPWLSVLFNCCRVYQRIYRTRDGSRYAGRCPRCGQPVTFTVGKGGTDARQFVVE